MSTVDEAASQNPPQDRKISGTAVAISLLVMGLTATTVMFVYWDLHTKPFRPLTEALGRTFKYSLPQVEGGRHKQGPMTLRIALRVPFSPDADEQRAQETLRTICDLIRRHQDLAGYEEVQIHLFQVLPEETAKKKTFEFTPEEIRTFQ